jgi:hypothetical protein
MHPASLDESSTMAHVKIAKNNVIWHEQKSVIWMLAHKAAFTL